MGTRLPWAKVILVGKAHRQSPPTERV